MKSATDSFVRTQDNAIIQRFKEAILYRRYWDGSKYVLESTGKDITHWVDKYGRINWKLDTEALNEHQTSNVQLTLKNTNNYWDELNASGVWNDGGTFIPNRSRIQIKAGVVTPGNVKESIFVFTGVITEPPNVRSGAPLATLLLKGREVVLEDVDAENFSKRPEWPRLQYDAKAPYNANDIRQTDVVWGADDHKWKIVRIYLGKGAGQERYITTNDADTLDIFSNWLIPPDNTSKFEILAENVLNDGDGGTTLWTTLNPGAGRIIDVWVDEVKQGQGAEYTVGNLNDKSGGATITFATPPGVGKKIFIDYIYWYQSVDPDFIIKELLELGGFASSEYEVDPVVMPNNVRVEWVQDTQADFQGVGLLGTSSDQDVSTTKQVNWLRLRHIPHSRPGDKYSEWTTFIQTGHPGQGPGRTVRWKETLLYFDHLEGRGNWAKQLTLDQQIKEQAGRYDYHAYYENGDEAEFIEFDSKDTEFVLTEDAEGPSGGPRWRYIQFHWYKPDDPTIIEDVQVQTNVSDTGAYAGEEDGWVEATVVPGQYPFQLTINSAQKRYIKTRIKYLGATDAVVNENFIIDWSVSFYFPWGFAYSGVRDMTENIKLLGTIIARDDDGLGDPATALNNRFVKYYSRFSPTNTPLAPTYTADIFSPTTIGETLSAWGPNEHQYRTVEISGGLGEGQVRFINSNDDDTLTITPNWDTTPDGSSAFRIYDWSGWHPVQENGQMQMPIAEFNSGVTRFLQTKTEMQTETVLDGGGIVDRTFYNDLGGGEFPRVEKITTDYFTSTFLITLANMTGLTAWTAIQQIAKMVDYEIGITATGTFFFRAKKTQITDGDVKMTIYESNRLFSIKNKKTAWDRVKNKIKVEYGPHTKIISPETELEDSPHSIDKYGERIFSISGGNLLAAEDTDIATGLALNYYAIFDASQAFIAHKYPEPKEEVRAVTKAMVRLDLSDVVKIIKTKPGTTGNKFIDDVIYLVMGISLDIENWRLELNLLQPYG